MWEDLDFILNKAYWIHIGVEKSYGTRVANLLSFVKVINKHKVDYWVYGRSLKTLILHGDLDISDHDDDLGFRLKNKEFIIETVLPDLEAEGFEIIRKQNNLVSIERNKRYLDLCFFEESKGNYSFGRGSFNKALLEEFISLPFHSFKLSIPKYSDEIISILYPCEKRSKRFRRIFSSILKRCKAVVRKIITLKKRPRRLTKEEFLDLRIEPENSLNWKLRKPHLDLITKNGTLSKVGDILDYCRGNLELLLQNVVETDTSREFLEPNHLDRRFWQTGNNYFFYCIYFGFKKEVVPYTEANRYIRNNNQENLYTFAYYDARPDFRENELRDFLKNNAIEVRHGCCIGGKHRVCAMIGHLARGKTYVPIYMKD